MGTSIVDRRKGIPGSDAAEKVEEMGGPIAQRASRKTADGPGFIDLRPKSQRQVADDDVQVTAEDSPDSDIEAWTPPPRTTFAERRRRFAEERTRAAENAPASSIPRRRTTTGDITPRRSSSGRTRTDQLPRERRQRRRIHWLVPVFTGMLLLMVLYTVCFWVYTIGLGVSNRVSYGPTRTSEVTADLGQGDSPVNPSYILASNVAGQIIVTILPGGDSTKAQVYEVPALEPSIWGNLSDVVVTIEVQQHSASPNIYLHLVGDPSYWHFFARPSLTLTLINTKQGFKVLV